MERLDELHLLTPLRVVAIVAVAVALTLVVRSVVRRLLRRTIVVRGTDPSRAEARQRALTGTLSSAAIGVIWTAAVITVISEAGVNITGVVATATVVGGAIAFGAQTLIRDVIGGFFVLAEDHYGVGDEVDLGLCQGVVERITLRSVRVRDGFGRVWHVAHGNVPVVGNLSQSPVLVLDLEVARPPSGTHSDADAALARMIDDLVAAAPPGLAGPPESVGVVRVEDNRLVYRVRASVRPDPDSHAAVNAAWRRVTLDAFARGHVTAPVPPVAPPSTPTPPR